MTCRASFTSATPCVLRANATACSFSVWLLTRPDNVTTPLKVSTSIRNPPTLGSLSIAVFTRVVIVVSSMASPTVFPQAEVSGATRISANIDDFHQLIFFIPSLRDRRGWPSRCGKRCNLHARDVEAGVDEQHLPGHTAAGITQ